ncbi:arylamine N-acetyltransferase 4 [Patellaria atrata CBS 101060]|uniref:Arylamine N-acetyltransferase 4 n=1 Tax=Patellaria atrata CBS 101060 TaxID=1346257 RepID=A0A9P4VQU9_9PEZI|nr:arylamine N-acetyltransferase 4 [Patellaria atrata CBS 101060]
MASAYNAAQLSEYLSYISLPESLHPTLTPTPESTSHLNLALLKALHVHHIGTIPYENLSIHYSGSHAVDIDPQHLFKKIVEAKRGRGGYCMESGILFYHVLKGLGFAVKHVGVRIRSRVEGVPAGEYIGWVHIVNLVTLPDGTRWMLDVAFGGDGPTHPLPLIPDVVTQNLGPQQVRLIRDHIPMQTDRTEATKLWIYQYRNEESRPWNSFYAFSELEFLPADYEVMNFYTSKTTAHIQVTTALVVRFLREGSEVKGKVMLVGPEVKRNLGGRTEVVMACKTEGERVEALERWFGITLTEKEREGIRGTIGEIKGQQGVEG